MIWLFFVAFILLGAGWLALARSKDLRRQSGLPQGQLVYADSHREDWEATTAPLFSARYQLVGKPDYLVKTKKGTIPVEVKSGKAPAVPYFGHILQLAAYCLLLEESSGQAPPNGLLKYADALYEVDFTRELRQELLAVMSEMRQARTERDAPRSHNQPGKCAACNFAPVCGQALTGNH